MAKHQFTKADIRHITELIDHYKENYDNFSTFLERLRILLSGNKDLSKQIHSLKWRLKDPEHLRNKLNKKLEDAKRTKKPFPINKDNLFQKINDLVGVRILHLHTKQMKEIDESLKKLFAEQRYQILKGPIAKTWDDESRSYFTEIGIRTERSPSMYTSVHYEVREISLSKYTFELQVRTLMEEVWGEVSHIFNYPDMSKNLTCIEQIKVLARATSTCSRLVDSIFKSGDSTTN